MPGAPTEIRSYARRWTKEALDTLVEIMNNEDAAPSARQSAAQALLDRGWGKAAQIIEGNPDAPMRLEVVITDPTRPADA